MRESGPNVSDHATAELVDMTPPEPPMRVIVPVLPAPDVTVADTVRTASIERVGADPPPEG